MSTPNVNVPFTASFQTASLLQPQTAGNPVSIPNAYSYNTSYAPNKTIPMVLPPDPRFLPNSTLVPDIQKVYSVNGVPVPPPDPIIYFPAVPLNTNTPTTGTLLYQNNPKNIKGITVDNCYLVGGWIYDSFGTPYLQLQRILVCWFK